MKILAIETSCDETAVAIVNATDQRFEILSALVNSQIKLHQKTGGVVPEVAARQHVIALPLALSQAFARAELTPKDIDVIGVTIGPGLVTSLMVGVETAKCLAWQWQKPLMAVNHLAGHIASASIDLDNQVWQKIKFPLMCLIVSGGHTEICLVNEQWRFTKVGQTL